MEPLILRRGMTAAALEAYLSADAALAPLSGQIASGVDGDLLLGTIQTCASKPSEWTAAIAQYFAEGAELGLIGKLALRLNSAADVEKAQSAEQTRAKKRQLQADRAEDVHKRLKLQAAIEEEEKKAVSGEAMGVLFESRKADSVAGVHGIAAAKRTYFETHGCQFNISFPADHPQDHHPYLFDNMDDVLRGMAPFPLLGGKLVGGPEKVMKKGKSKGAVLEVHAAPNLAAPTLAAPHHLRRR